MQVSRSPRWLAPALIVLAVCACLSSIVQAQGGGGDPPPKELDCARKKPPIKTTS